MMNGFESEQTKRLLADAMREQTKEQALARVRLHRAADEAKKAELKARYLKLRREAMQKPIEKMGEVHGDTELPGALRGMLAGFSGMAFDVSQPLSEQTEALQRLIDTLKKLVD